MGDYYDQGELAEAHMEIDNMHSNGLPGKLHAMCECPRKPPNRKGVRHHECCWHDEPDITLCTCGASREST